MSRRKKYTNQFKEQAVALAKDIGYTDASAKLGVPYSTLVLWRDKIAAKGGIAVNKKGEAVDLAEELKKAQKEITELKKINIILKSAAAFFSQDHLK